MPAPYKPGDTAYRLPNRDKWENAQQITITKVGRKYATWVDAHGYHHTFDMKTGEAVSQWTRVYFYASEEAWRADFEKRDLERRTEAAWGELQRWNYTHRYVGFPSHMTLEKIERVLAILRGDVE